LNEEQPLQSPTLKRILRRKEFKISEKEWLSLYDHEREAIKDYRQQSKILEQTRGDRIGNDKKEGVLVDAADLSARVTKIANEINNMMEHQIGDVLPVKVFQVEDLAEVIAACRATLVSIQENMGLLWSEIDKR
jgi:hypothetical protein